MILLFHDQESLDPESLVKRHDEEQSNHTQDGGDEKRVARNTLVFCASTR